MTMASSSVVFVSIFFLLILLCSAIITVDASANKTELINQFLDAHNSARKALGVPPLKWEPLLATFARVYSNQRRHDCALVRSTALAFGENIFIGQGRQWSANDAVAAWAAEKQLRSSSMTTLPMRAQALTAPTARRSCGAPQNVWGAPGSSVTMGAATSLVSNIPPGTMLGPSRTDLVWPLGPVLFYGDIQHGLVWRRKSFKSPVGATPNRQG